MAGLVSRVCPRGPNTAQWTVQGDHNLGGTVDGVTVSVHALFGDKNNYCGVKFMYIPVLGMPVDVPVLKLSLRPVFSVVYEICS
jgi:hypothetical protein